MISIREAVYDDLPAIYGLVRELAIYEKAEESLTIDVDEYRRLFHSGLFKATVAEKEDTIIGTCIYYDTFSTWRGKMLYLEDFVVNEAYRRHGTGQLLWDHLVAYAKNNQYSLLKWQVLEWNEPAIKFYEKNESIIEKEWYNGKILF